MADIKRTTEGLEHCIARYIDGLCDDCPYMGEIDRSYMIPMKCKEIIMRDALELLKEQQPKNGKWVGINEYVYHLEQETGERYCVSAYYDGDLFCNQCWTAHRKTKYNFCPNCGADMRGEQE